MLSDEQLSLLEETIDTIYSSGVHPDQKSILNTYMNDPSKIPICQQIVENTNSSNNIIHFALTSLRSLFEIVYIQWNSDIFNEFQDWCLKNLFNKAEFLNSICINAFCKLYGELISCGFRLFPNFQFVSETIQFFFTSNQIYHVEIGLNLCTNVIYSLKGLRNRLVNQLQVIKETTILSCFIMSSNILQNQLYLNVENIYKNAMELLIACITFDEDITIETTMIFLPKTENWANQLLNINNLLSIIATLYFDSSYSEEFRKIILDLIFYLTSIRLDPPKHVEYINNLIPIIIQIIESNPLFSDTKNICQINNIILKINHSIISKDISLFPSFKPFLSSVFSYTNQFFEINTFISCISEVSVLLKFWSNICTHFPQKVKKLTAISQNLYDTLINVASSGIDLISQFGLKNVNHITSFVYKIGLRNDRNFFMQIFTNFDFFQNELYSCYAAYLAGNEESVPCLSPCELKVVYAALIISLPIVNKLSVGDERLVSFSMIYLLHFFNRSLEKVTLVPKNVNSEASDAFPVFHCMRVENVVTYLISKIERSSEYVDRSFNSFVMINGPVQTTEKLHSFLLNRLLLIAASYPSDEPIMEAVFASALGFYSLDLKDVSLVYLCGTFLDRFLYRKMRLRPNKRENNFLCRNWSFRTRLFFHKFFGKMMSSCYDSLDEEMLGDVDFMSYLKDLKSLIQKMENNVQATVYLLDLYGLFKSVQNSKVYAILFEFFFPVLQLFKKYQIQYHVVLKFFAEFTQNRNERISSEKVEGNENQEKSLNDLIIFKEGSYYLNCYFAQFLKVSDKLTFELKYAYRLLSNIIDNYSSIIGAMKFYGDQVYSNLFVSFTTNIDFIITNLQSIINFDMPTVKSMKIINEMLHFAAVLGSKSLLFMDTFNTNNKFFTSMLLFVNKTLISINLKLACFEDFDFVRSILINIFNLVFLITKFFLENKGNDMGSVLIINQDANRAFLVMIFDGILEILFKYPNLMNNIIGISISNIYNLYPEQNLIDKLSNIVQFLMQNLQNVEPVLPLQKILHDSEA